MNSVGYSWEITSCLGCCTYIDLLQHLRPAALARGAQMNSGWEIASCTYIDLLQQASGKVKRFFYGRQMDHGKLWSHMESLTTEQCAKFFEERKR